MAKGASIMCAPAIQFYTDCRYTSADSKAATTDIAWKGILANSDANVEIGTEWQYNGNIFNNYITNQ